jgi:hypothetical protein
LYVCQPTILKKMKNKIRKRPVCTAIASKTQMYYSP